jgi:hypothetical protein
MACILNFKQQIKKVLSSYLGCIISKLPTITEIQGFTLVSFRHAAPEAHLFNSVGLSAGKGVNAGCTHSQPHPT